MQKYEQQHNLIIMISVCYHLWITNTSLLIFLDLIPLSKLCGTMLFYRGSAVLKMVCWNSAWPHIRKCDLLNWSSNDFVLNSKIFYQNKQFVWNQQIALSLSECVTECFVDLQFSVKIDPMIPLKKKQKIKTNFYAVFIFWSFTIFVFREFLLTNKCLRPMRRLLWWILTFPHPWWAPRVNFYRKLKINDAFSNTYG